MRSNNCETPIASRSGIMRSKRRPSRTSLDGQWPGSSPSNPMSQPPWLMARTVGEDLWSTSWQGLHCANKSFTRKNALAIGIEIDDLSIEVSGDVDPRGVLGVGDVSPGFVENEISYTSTITSPATPAEVAELVERAERHCPAHASLRDAVELDRTVLVNGEPLFA